MSEEARESAIAAWVQIAGDEDAAWGAAQPGPPLRDVLQRLSSVPRPFLDPTLDLGAVAADVLGDAARTLRATAHTAAPGVVTGAAIALWLVASETLAEPLDPSPAASAGIARAVDALALRVGAVVDPLSWLSDDERREEAARCYLLWSGFVPTGESLDEARTRLEARDSLRRDAALAEAYRIERHRAEVARALADARAKEAAARYTHE